MKGGNHNNKTWKGRLSRPFSSQDRYYSIATVPSAGAALFARSFSQAFPMFLSQSMYCSPPVHSLISSAPPEVSSGQMMGSKQ